MPYIKRDIDKKIQNWYKSNTKSLMILGARQIGKSESVKEFLRNLYGIRNDELLPIIDLENLPVIKEQIIKGEAPGGPSFIRNLFANADKMVDLDKCKIILIDEVQSLSNSKKGIAQTEITKILTKLISEEEFRFIFSGSLLGSKIHDIEKLTKDLPGGIEHFYMYPISFAEFVKFLDKNDKNLKTAKEQILKSQTISEEVHVSLLKRYGEYCFVGGMPISVLTYEDKKYSVSESMLAIHDLIDGYEKDITKYYKDELDLDIKHELFEQLIAGIKNNDKAEFMKAFKDDPHKTLYKFLIDSDVGLLVSHIDEYGASFDKQKMPKTYFSDVGFMRHLIEERIQLYRDYNEMPGVLRDYFHKDSLDVLKNNYINYIDGNGGSTFPGAGYFFEQVIAQNIKAISYVYAYKFIKKTQTELEFILPSNDSAIEVKSGDLGSCKSSISYAKTGKNVYLLSLLPYVCRAYENFYLLPIYSVCLLNQNELCQIKFEDKNKRIDEILKSRRLPDTKGFF